MRRAATTTSSAKVPELSRLSYRGRVACIVVLCITAGLAETTSAPHAHLQAVSKLSATYRRKAKNGTIRFRMVSFETALAPWLLRRVATNSRFYGNIIPIGNDGFALGASTQFPSPDSRMIWRMCS